MGLEIPAHYAVHNAPEALDRAKLADFVPQNAGLVRILLYSAAFPGLPGAGSVPGHDCRSGGCSGASVYYARNERFNPDVAAGFNLYPAYDAAPGQTVAEITQAGLCHRHPGRLALLLAS